MAYRPQFAFPTPPGFHDEPFEHFFDYTNVPALQFNLLGNQPVTDIPLTLEPDAEFHWRGVQVGDLSTMGPLGVKFKDDKGNALSSDYVPETMYSGNLGPDLFEGGEAQALEPEIVCAPNGIPRVSLKNLGAGAWAKPLPGIVDALKAVYDAGQSVGTIPAYVGGGVGGSAASATPFWYEGQLYQVLCPVGVASLGATKEFEILKFDPVANSWRILDDANAPPRAAVEPAASGAVLFDGDHTVIVAYQPDDFTAGGLLTIYEFDLSTGTWGGAVSAGAPTVNLVNQLFKRSDGSIVVITTRAVVGPSIVGITAQILTAGVWSAVDLDTNLPGGQTSNGGSAAVYDPLTDLIHVFGIANAGGVNDAFYQALTLANTLGTFQDFTNADFQVNAWGMGNPVIVDDTIYFGVVDPSKAFPSLLVGSPSTAPAFAAVTLNIDPTGPGITQGAFSPFGGRVSLAYDTTSGVMYGVYTPDGVGLRFLWNATGQWNAQWIGHQIPAVSQVDGTQYGGLTFGSGVDYVLIGVANGHVYVLTDLDPVTLGQPVAYLIEMITTVNVPITLRGVKRFSAAVCK